MPSVYLTEDEIHALGEMIEQVRSSLEGCGDEYFDNTSLLVGLALNAEEKMLKSIRNQKYKNLVAKYVRDGLAVRRKEANGQ